MEDYIGTKLLFETSKGTVSGTLKVVEENAGKLVIEDGDGLKDVLIEDIQRLEIVEEMSRSNLSMGLKICDNTEKSGTEDARVEDVKENEASISITKTSENRALWSSSNSSGKSSFKRHRNDETGATLKNKMNEGLHSAKRIDGTSHNPKSLELHSVSQAEIKTVKTREALGSTMENKNNSNGKSHPGCENNDNISGQNTASSGISREGKFAPEATEENYYKMMNRAFAYFGPLEEEFSSIAARQTYRIFATYFDNRKTQVEVFIKGDDVFSCIGLILARLLLQSGKTSSVVCDGSFIKNSDYRQAYINSGGQIFDKPSGLANVHIYACNRSVMPNYPKNGAKGLIYLDIPVPEVSEGETRIGLCFGSVPSHFRGFNGIVYFIDIEYPIALYEEFGLSRPTKSKIYKIK